MNRYLLLTSVLVIGLIVFRPGPIMAEAAVEEPETDMPALASNVSEHMHDQLSGIGTIKAAIVAGRLAAVQEPATWLADHETVAGLPPNFEPYVAQLKGYARHVIEARDLGRAADAVSKMAQTCGNCHLANDINLEFGYDRLPREDVEDVITHMQRHQWAADRLWEGLIGPSDTAWSRGTNMLLDVPLASDDVTTASEHFEEISRITRRIHALGGIGTETVTPDARSELYGEVLGLCAGCHVLLRRGPAT